jgi:DNA-binding NarL/FixJ family response regulator
MLHSFSVGEHSPGTIHSFQDASEPCSERPFGRVMLISRPSLLLECLREAMNVRGIQTGIRPFEQQLSADTCGYDAFVIFLMRSESGLLAMVKERVAELRSQVPHVPVVALVEDADGEAVTVSGMGFSTVVLGLPSVSFAVDVVYLLLLGRRHTHESDTCEDTIRDGGPAESTHHEPGLTTNDICFTPREAELLDLLRRGLQNKLIAYQLKISESTVKAHLRSIMMKLKAKNRTQAVCMLVRLGEGKDHAHG